ncbi:MAG: hypothetical protein H6999_05890 [Hahellaceae bacterium]|nr:hypothetical protein [Hahellaceae bacterium]MCP5169271.1 hypothetical protein [Hahellaceae bacterium]
MKKVAPPEFELTHTGLYHLEQLEETINDRYQQSFDIDDDDSLRALIKFASRLQDTDVQREFLLFFLNCGPDFQAFLRSGDVVDENNYIKRTN